MQHQTYLIVNLKVTTYFIYYKIRLRRQNRLSRLKAIFIVQDEEICVKVQENAARY